MAMSPVKFNNAAQETKSGRLTLLPPPPDAVVKKGKKHAGTSDMPRSLRRMLELKVTFLPVLHFKLRWAVGYENHLQPYQEGLSTCL